MPVEQGLLNGEQWETFETLAAADKTVLFARSLSMRALFSCVQPVRAVCGSLRDEAIGLSKQSPIGLVAFPL